MNVHFKFSLFLLKVRHEQRIQGELGQSPSLLWCMREPRGWSPLPTAPGNGNYFHSGLQGTNISAYILTAETLPFKGQKSIFRKENRDALPTYKLLLNFSKYVRILLNHKPFHLRYHYFFCVFPPTLNLIIKLCPLSKTEDEKWIPK